MAPISVVILLVVTVMVVVVVVVVVFVVFVIIGNLNAMPVFFFTYVLRLPGLKANPRICDCKDNNFEVAVHNKIRP
jgi:uncharacterized protein YneF (UPF0154 family)